ncbi:maltose acetyltransferase domain-containing protein [Lactococcus lactis]|uniref:maltose acetyltransferase domain-containing protein n=1 Tax=Lactococcus lactis TaxID=1358 RepID=UPI003BF85BB9
MIETNNREKIHTGELYFPNDTDLWNEQLQTLHLLEEYNQLSVNETGKQKNLLTRMFAELVIIVISNLRSKRTGEVKTFILEMIFMQTLTSH